MREKKRIPAWAILLVALGIGIPVFEKFRPLLTESIASLQEPSPTPSPDNAALIADRDEKLAILSDAGSVSPTPANVAPTSVASQIYLTPEQQKTLALLNGGSSDQTAPSSSTSAPITPTPATNPPVGYFPNRPTADDISKFINEYTASGMDILPALQAELYLKFPLTSFFGEAQMSQSMWEADRQCFAKLMPHRIYGLEGAIVTLSDGPGDTWRVIAPIFFVLRKNDGTNLVGISFDKFSLEWSDGLLRITSQDQAGIRTVLKSAGEISIPPWQDGKVAYTRDGSTNLRFTDDDSSGEATILRRVPSGTSIKFVPENKDWLIVKDPDGVVGFMATRYIVN